MGFKAREYLPRSLTLSQLYELVPDYPHTVVLYRVRTSVAPHLLKKEVNKETIKHWGKQFGPGKRGYYTNYWHAHAALLKLRSEGIIK